MARDKKKDAPRKPVMHALAEKAKPANVRVHIRGNPAKLGEEAPRRFLPSWPATNPPPFTQGSGRLELAQAIASKDNPLTARVMVNRVWQHHFGRGLVGTPSNFGNLGERPTHPELLDYLASRFVDQRLVDQGAAPRNHAVGDVPAEQPLRRGTTPRSIPTTDLLWRMNRRRLEVEPWRDAMLAVSGKLDRTVGGPPTDLASPREPPPDAVRSGQPAQPRSRCCGCSTSPTRTSPATAGP